MYIQNLKNNFILINYNYYKKKFLGFKNQILINKLKEKKKFVKIFNKKSYRKKKKKFLKSKIKIKNNLNFIMKYKIFNLFYLNNLTKFNLLCLYFLNLKKNSVKKKFYRKNKNKFFRFFIKLKKNKKNKLNRKDKKKTKKKHIFIKKNLFKRWIIIKYPRLQRNLKNKKIPYQLYKNLEKAYNFKNNLIEKKYKNVFCILNYKIIIKKTKKKSLKKSYKKLLKRKYKKVLTKIYKVLLKKKIKIRKKNIYKLLLKKKYKALKKHKLFKKNIYRLLKSKKYRSLQNKIYKMLRKKKAKKIVKDKLKRLKFNLYNFFKLNYSKKILKKLIVYFYNISVIKMNSINKVNPIIIRHIIKRKRSFYYNKKSQREKIYKYVIKKIVNKRVKKKKNKMNYKKKKLKSMLYKKRFNIYKKIKHSRKNFQISKRFFVILRKVIKRNIEKLKKKKKKFFSFFKYKFYKFIRVKKKNNRFSVNQLFQYLNSYSFYKIFARRRIFLKFFCLNIKKKSKIYLKKFLKENKKFYFNLKNEIMKKKQKKIIKKKHKFKISLNKNKFINGFGFRFTKNFSLTNKERFLKYKNKNKKCLKSKKTCIIRKKNFINKKNSKLFSYLVRKIKFSFFFKLNQVYNKKKNKNKNKKYNKYEYRRLKGISKLLNIRNKIIQLRFLMSFVKKLKKNKNAPSTKSGLKGFLNISSLTVFQKKKKILFKNIDLPTLLNSRKIDLDYLNMDFLEEYYFLLNESLKNNDVLDDFETEEADYFEEQISMQDDQIVFCVNDCFNFYSLKKKRNKNFLKLKTIIYDDIENKDVSSEFNNISSSENNFYIFNEKIDTIKISKYLIYRFFFSTKNIKFRFYKFKFFNILNKLYLYTLKTKKINKDIFINFSYSKLLFIN